MPCLSTGELCFYSFLTYADLQFLYYLQQLVAIFHGCVLLAGTLPNCDFTKVWRWYREHKSLPRDCPLHNSSYCCIGFWPSNHSSQGSRSHPSGELILNDKEGKSSLSNILIIYDDNLFADRLGFSRFGYNGQHYRISDYLRIFCGFRQ